MFEKKLLFVNYLFLFFAFFFVAFFFAFFFVAFFFAFLFGAFFFAFFFVTFFLAAFLFGAFFFAFLFGAFFFAFFLVAIKISFIAIPGIRFSAPILFKYFIRYTFNVKQILVKNNPKKFLCRAWLFCVV